MKKVILGIIASSCISTLLSGCGGYDIEGPETEYNTNRPYRLPYPAGFSRDLYQGYFGTVSHAGEYSLDFLMPVGSDVLAARSGVVETVVDHHSVACPVSKNCSNNVIYIRHADGTQGRYLHLQTDGACVSVGDTVEQGDVIALSGNVGISAAPHLHFQVVSSDPANLDSADRPSFVGVDGNGTGFPSAKLAYVSTNEVKTNYCTAASN